MKEREEKAKVLKIVKELQGEERDVIGEVEDGRSRPLKVKFVSQGAAEFLCARAWRLRS